MMKSMRVWGFVPILFAIMVAAGCGGDDDDDDDATAEGASGKSGASGSGRSSGTGAKGGAGGSAGRGPLTGTTWPAPTAACGSLGQDCANCTGNTICWADVSLCLPRARGLLCTPGACDDAAPYCLNGACMTADEASCVCAAPMAKEKIRECSGGPTAAAGSCIANGQFCDSAPSKCCGGLSCIQAPNILGQCMKTCSADGDCAPGCCLETGIGPKVCGTCGGTVPSTQCVEKGMSCSGNPPCCPGNTCVTSDNPKFAGCRGACMTNADCDTGCCQPFTGKTNGFCAQAEYCTCRTAGMPCGGNEPKCCDDTACISMAGGASMCTDKCTASAECPSQCCIAVTGTDFKVCSSQGPC